MKRILTKTKELTRISLVGKTEAISAEVQLAGDSQLKATNCRWGGSFAPAIPFYEQGQFRAFLCLRKTSLPKARQSSFGFAQDRLNNKVDLSNSR
jgi:hypothetical protein